MVIDFCSTHSLFALLFIHISTWQSSSVLVDGDRVAKLCDFGIPYIKLGLQQTRAANVLATALRWSAPELTQVCWHCMIPAAQWSLIFAVTSL